MMWHFVFLSNSMSMPRRFNKFSPNQQISVQCALAGRRYLLQQGHQTRPKSKIVGSNLKDGKHLI